VASKHCCVILDPKECQDDAYTAYTAHAAYTAHNNIGIIKKIATRTAPTIGWSYFYGVNMLLSRGRPCSRWVECVCPADLRAIGNSVNGWEAECQYSRLVRLLEEEALGVLLPRSRAVVAELLCLREEGVQTAAQHADYHALAFLVWFR
jgi:hypothetical protein